MRFPVDISKVQLVCGGEAEPSLVYDTKEQRTNQKGEPLFQIQLMAGGNDRPGPPGAPCPVIYQLRQDGVSWPAQALAAPRTALVCQLSCGGLNGPQAWSTVCRHDRRGCSRKHCRPTVFDRLRESGLES